MYLNILKEWKIPNSQAFFCLLSALQPSFIKNVINEQIYTDVDI